MFVWHLSFSYFWAMRQFTSCPSVCLILSHTFTCFLFLRKDESVTFPFFFQVTTISGTKKNFWIYEILRHLLVTSSCFKGRNIEKALFFFFFPFWYFRWLKPCEKLHVYNCVWSVIIQYLISLWLMKNISRHIYLITVYSYQCVLEIKKSWTKNIPHCQCS